MIMVYIFVGGYVIILSRGLGLCQTPRKNETTLVLAEGDVYRIGCTYTVADALRQNITYLPIPRMGEKFAFVSFKGFPLNVMENFAGIGR